jgi:ABC-type bacteriocin/lantibiotic exporter with double-glycine peptidase domain
VKGEKMRKIKIVKQNDLKDCGVACLLSIIRFYNGNVPLETLRIDTHTDQDGTSFYNLIITAQKYGLNAVGYKINYEEINDSKIIFPIIAQVIINSLPHFIVIYKINNKKVTIMDPSVGKKEMKLEQFLTDWTGNIITFYPNRELSFIKNENKLLSSFYNFAQQEKKMIFEIFISSLLLIIFEIISSYYLKIGIDKINSFNFETFKLIIIFFLLITIFKSSFKYLQLYYENYLNKNLDVYLMYDFLTHLFNLPSKVIQSRTSGEIMTRVNEINNIKNLFSEIFVTLFLDLFLALITIPILYNINKYLLLILSICLFLYLILGYLFSKKIYKRVMQNITYEDNFNTSLLENINCFNSIKNLNATKKILQKIEYELSIYIYDNFTFSSLLNNQESIKNFINEICYFLVNSFGFYFIKKNIISVSDLILFNSLMTFFLEPIKNLINSLPKYNILKASYTKISEFMNINEDVKKTKKNVSIEKYNITFDNVTFSYNDYDNILSNYCLNIKENEHIILKGSSGSGKSTICKLIAKEEENIKGNIYIGNLNYNDLNNNDIKNNVMYISQKEYLYSDTIRNNILFYRDIKENDFIKICQICHIDEIVNKKPLRYETIINMDSNNLSGGEKQRIVLARACLNDFKILILDEALSEVDINLEKEIINNLRLVFKEKTIIYVSHKNEEYLFDRTIFIGGKNAKLCKI